MQHAHPFSNVAELRLPAAADQCARPAAHAVAANIPRLRVLHVYAFFRPDFTGEGLYLEKLAPRLERFGIRSRVIATRTLAPAQPPHLPALGAPRYCRRGTVLARLAAFLAELRRADIVHFHCMVDRHFILHLAARLAGRRVVQSSTLDDGLGEVVGSYRPAYRGVARRLCRTIDATVAISPKLHADSRTVLPPGRVHLIPQGVALPPPGPAGEREALRARLGIPAEAVLLLYVGSMAPRKDVRFLVAHHPAPAHRRINLLLVGPNLDDAYAAQVGADIANSASIRRLPYMDDPAPAYAAADLFVFASRQEGFGNVLLEAMAAGLPVVARRLPGVTDSFIDHGRTGFLFDEAAQYRAIVLALAGDADRRRAIGDAARAEVLARFDLDDIAARYADLYRAVHSGGRA